MRVSNLQLQGLLMAVASINNLLVRKGVLDIDEIDMALREAEASLVGEERLFEDMSASNRDAVCFPIRFLQAANNTRGETFINLARSVGTTKQSYTEQS